MPRKDRLEQAEANQLKANSLVGSFFHGSDEYQVQGCVVAEIAPQVYLVETFEWIAGTSIYQEIVHLHEMKGWRFYDSSDWMSDHYKTRLSHRWEAINKKKYEEDKNE